MQCLSCVLSCLAICIEELRDAAEIVQIIAQIVYMVTTGCMTAQMFYELDPSKQAAGAPPLQEMTRQDQQPAKTGANLAGSEIPMAQPVHGSGPPQIPVQATPVQATYPHAQQGQQTTQAPYPANMTKS